MPNIKFKRLPAPGLSLIRLVCYLRRLTFAVARLDFSQQLECTLARYIDLHVNADIDCALSETHGGGVHVFSPSKSQLDGGK